MNVWTQPSDLVHVDRVVELSTALNALGEAIDHTGSFPHAAIDAVRQAGLLMAPFNRQHGGTSLGCKGQADDLVHVLRLIGAGDLSVGRLYEGHVNAVHLVQRYGRPEQIERLRDAVRDGAMSAVWNAEGAQPLRFNADRDGWVVEGSKILASGAGSITRPLVTGLAGDDHLMAVLDLDASHPVDMSRWTPQGMRSSATGTIDLTGHRLLASDIIGGAGDYKRQPGFSGGAWRFCAVQLGAIERLVDLFRQALNERGRNGDPFQQARIAASVAAAETAALWVEKAARLLDDETLPEAEIVAYTGLTRMVTERAGLDVMEHVHRGIGLMSFMWPDPVERISRDLATYLRQPAPDGAMADAAATVLAATPPLRALWGGR